MLVRNRITKTEDVISKEGYANLVRLGMANNLVVINDSDANIKAIKIPAKIEEFKKSKINIPIPVAKEVTTEEEPKID